MEESIRVLYVDDDASSLEIRASILESEFGLEVITATDVNSGIEIIEDRGIDCILSDLKMPNRDGFDFLKEVRERDPDIPFILFTSHESDDIAQKAFEEGATDYFPKSIVNISYELLANRINQVVSHYQSQRSQTSTSIDVERSDGVQGDDTLPNSDSAGLSNQLSSAQKEEMDEFLWVGNEFHWVRNTLDQKPSDEIEQSVQAGPTKEQDSVSAEGSRPPVPSTQEITATDATDEDEKTEDETSPCLDSQPSKYEPAVDDNGTTAQPDQQDDNSFKTLDSNTNDVGDGRGGEPDQIVERVSEGQSTDDLSQVIDETTDPSDLDTAILSSLDKYTSDSAVQHPNESNQNTSTRTELDPWTENADKDVDKDVNTNRDSRPYQVDADSPKSKEDVAPEHGLSRTEIQAGIWDDDSGDETSILRSGETVDAEFTSETANDDISEIDEHRQSGTVQRSTPTEDRQSESDDTNSDSGSGRQESESAEREWSEPSHATSPEADTVPEDESVEGVLHPFDSTAFDDLDSTELEDRSKDELLQLIQTASAKDTGSSADQSAQEEHPMAAREESTKMPAEDREIPKSKLAAEKPQARRNHQDKPTESSSGEPDDETHSSSATPSQTDGTESQADETRTEKSLLDSLKSAIYPSPATESESDTQIDETTSGGSDIHTGRGQSAGSGPKTETESSDETQDPDVAHVTDDDDGPSASGPWETADEYSRPADLEIEPGTTVLVQSGSQDSRKSKACTDLLCADYGRFENADVLLIRYLEMKKGQLTQIARQANQVTIISIGYTQPVPDIDETPIETIKINNPNDVTRTGIVVSATVDEWEPLDTQTVVCYDPIDVLLQYKTPQSAFRFLHILTNRLKSVGAISHFHVDPDSADPHEISSFKPLFDSVLSIDSFGVHLEDH